ncbi:MAG: hypothetical protein M0T84_15335 [Betaproteobacteria bacterium]|nr:hypothetical protein [Betaproteobacteria bacterium]
MATLIDRSPWAVSVRNRDDFYREFPYDKQAQAEAYTASPETQGLKGSLKRLANQFQVKSRRKGAAPFCQSVDTLEEAKRLKLNLEAEQSRSTFRDDGVAYRHMVRSLMERYIDEVAP